MLYLKYKQSIWRYSMNPTNIPPRIGQCWIENNICHIPLHDGSVALCDEDRMPEVNIRSWTKSTGKKNRMYAKAKINNKTVEMHRYLYPDCPDGMQIDHINGNRLDNRSCNLRFCSQKDNIRNQKIRVNNTSGFKGVCIQKKLKISPFCAYIYSSINKKIKRTYLGLFKTAEEAAKRYDEECVKRHGEFARTNFPIENYLPKK